MSALWYNSHADVFVHGREAFYVAKEKVKEAFEFRSFPTWEGYEAFQWTSWKKKPSLLLFHELAPHWKKRRLHFDVDYHSNRRSPFNAEVFLEHLLSAIEYVLTQAELPIDLNDVWILDASRETADGRKHSFHIIISTICTTTHQESLIFAERVKDRVSYTIPSSDYDGLKGFDMGIYQSNRNFRMAYCTKRAQYAPLLPLETFRHNGVEYHKHLPEDPRERMKVVLKNTLLTVTDECLLWSCEVPKTLLQVYSSELTEGDVQTAVDLTKSVLTESEFAFDVGRTQHRHIRLERVRPGPCRICVRVHTSDNSTLYVGETGRVHLTCWCDKKKTSYYLGTITVDGRIIKDDKVGTTQATYLKLPEGSEVRKSSSDYIGLLLQEYGYITTSLEK